MSTPTLVRSFRILLAIALVQAMILFVAPAAPVHAENTPIPMPIADWEPVKPGEHPRLLFRKSDIPTLRARAQTETGQAIIARLKETLGGGEAMPTLFSDHRPLRYGDGDNQRRPVGTFTTWHASGFGFLYILTGEQKYADLARQCLEKVFEGQVDRDPRYNYERTGGEIRVGPMLAAIAYAYDFCYDAWPEDFRRKVANKILQYETIQATTTKRLTTEMIVRTPRHHPANNHWGSQVGGMGIALLAIKDDPGVDHRLINEYLEIIERNAVLQLTQGFGEGGWHSEGTHPGRIPATTGFLEFLHVARVAWGKDFVSPSVNAQWMTLRWLMEIVPSGETIRGGGRTARVVPSRPLIPHRGDYGDDNLYARSPMLSHGGEFAHGLGAVPDQYKPAMLWVWNQFVEGEGNPRPFDTHAYPHRAIHAFVHWPIGVEPVNPEQVLPRVVEDRSKGYYIFRNRWQDKNDAVVTALLGNAQHRGFKHVSGGDVIIVAEGIRLRGGRGIAGLGGFRSARLVHFQGYEDGSGILTATNHNEEQPRSLAVDFSGRSGAPVVVALATHGERDIDPEGLRRTGHDGAFSQGHRLRLGEYTVVLVTIQRGDAPEVTLQGDRIRIGGQTLRMDGPNLVLEHTARAVQPHHETFQPEAPRPFSVARP
ncbi:MAG: hypothetical protein JJU36_08185 [Phycisphaeraceae bacterium]|nr:hypothetical protein [Phycisphaeraceae bacterium]